MSPDNNVEDAPWDPCGKSARIALIEWDRLESVLGINTRRNSLPWSAGDAGPCACLTQ